MRKVSSLILLLIFAFASVCGAQTRGALRNIYASWVNITTAAGQTVTFPSESRDLWVHNGSAVAVCVSLNGTAFSTNPSVGSCYNNTNNYTVQLDAYADIYLYDYLTTSVRIKPATGTTASPVSVVVTY